MVGCEGVELRGSGRADSYDSYPGFPNVGVNDSPTDYDANNHNANATVRTLENGDVELVGNSPVYGDVSSVRDVITTGSSPIHGNVHANRDVNLAGNNTFYGNVQSARDVHLSSGTMAGNVLTNRNIFFSNWGGTIDGNAQYGGEIFFTNRGEDHVGGEIIADYPGVEPVDEELCDPLDILGAVGEVSLPDSGALSIGANTDPVLMEDGFLGGNGPIDLEEGVVDFLDHTDAAAFRLSELSIGSNGSLTIGEPGNPQHVVLFVDGDVDVGGGGDGLVVESGSTLTLVAGGRVDLRGSVDIRGQGVVTPQEGSDGTVSLVPTLGLYSTAVQGNLQGNQAGVRLRGNTDMYATVYAPHADVSVGGSGNLFGSVRGKTAEFFGAGGMHYDEALRHVSGGGDADADEDGAPGGFHVVGWRERLP